MPEPTGAPIGDFDGLLSNLDRQSLLYDRLLALSDRERDAIGRADLATIAQVMREKERIIGEAQALEQQRETACAAFARIWGLAQSPTISQMRARVRSPEIASRLDAAAVKLSERVQRLRRANQRNAHLIAQAQRMSGRLLAAALRHAHHPIYDRRGDTAAEKRRSLLLDYRV